MRKIKAPPGQRSTYGKTGLPAEYIAKKRMGEEALAKTLKWAKDPTEFQSFELYGIHHPSGVRPVFSENVTVYLKRVGITIPYEEFIELNREFLLQNSSTGMIIWYMDSFGDKVQDDAVEYIENRILTKPEQDPFDTEDMMEEL